MDPQQSRPLAALARVRGLVDRDGELVGEEPLTRLLECAREAVGAGAARLERSAGQVRSSSLEWSAPGTLVVTSAVAGTQELPALVLEDCASTTLTETQTEVLLLCGSLIGSVVRATDRTTRRQQREARRDAVHAVAMASVEHIDLDEMLLAAVEALRLGVRCQGVTLWTFDDPESSATRPHSASYPTRPEGTVPQELMDISSRSARACWEHQRASILSLDDPQRDFPLSESERDYMFDFMRMIGSRNLLMAPLSGGGECQGFIALTRTTVEEPFDAEDEATVMTIGRELGNAVVHSRLFARQRLLVDELQELHDYKDSFVATVAHQLKSPLTSIMGHVELLDEEPAPDLGPDSGLASRSLRTMHRSAERIQRTVDGLLTLSKVQLSDRPIASSVVPLDALVRGCAELVSTDARERGVTLDLERLRSDSLAWGDPTELETLLDNLLSNAVKYSSRGGTVTIATFDEDAGVVLECTDEGHGIDAADLERLFDPFYRSANPATVEEPGTGLGMTIVKAVVQRHRGRIDVASTLGQGTTFRVWLPSPAHSG